MFMLIKYNQKKDKYGILDTEDSVLEYYSFDELLDIKAKTGVEVVGWFSYIYSLREGKSGYNNAIEFKKGDESIYVEMGTDSDSKYKPDNYTVYGKTGVYTSNRGRVFWGEKIMSDLPAVSKQLSSSSYSYLGKFIAEEQFIREFLKVDSKRRRPIIPYYIYDTFKEIGICSNQGYQEVLMLSILKYIYSKGSYKLNKFSLFDYCFLDVDYEEFCNNVVIGKYKDNLYISDGVVLIVIKESFIVLNSLVARDKAKAMLLNNNFNLDVTNSYLIIDKNGNYILNNSLKGIQIEYNDVNSVKIDNFTINSMNPKFKIISSKNSYNKLLKINTLTIKDGNEYIKDFLNLVQSVKVIKIPHYLLTREILINLEIEDKLVVTDLNERTSDMFIYSLLDFSDLEDIKSGNINSNLCRYIKKIYKSNLINNIGSPDLRNLIKTLGTSTSCYMLVSDYMIENKIRYDRDVNEIVVQRLANTLLTKFFINQANSIYANNIINYEDKCSAEFMKSLFSKIRIDSNINRIKKILGDWDLKLSHNGGNSYVVLNTYPKQILKLEELMYKTSFPFIDKLEMISKLKQIVTRNNCNLFLNSNLIKSDIWGIAITRAYSDPEMYFDKYAQSGSTLAIYVDCYYILDLVLSFLKDCELFDSYLIFVDRYREYNTEFSTYNMKKPCFITTIKEFNPHDYAILYSWDLFDKNENINIYYNYEER